mgnify:CR=1 FL=1
MQEKLLTPDQVAQILQVHPFTILKFIKQGRLKASKLGRVYRIRESDLENFLNESTNEDKVKEYNDTPKPKRGRPAKTIEAEKAEIDELKQEGVQEEIIEDTKELIQNIELKQKKTQKPQKENLETPSNQGDPESTNHSKGVTTENGDYYYILN